MKMGSNEIFKKAAIFTDILFVILLFVTPKNMFQRIGKSPKLGIAIIQHNKITTASTLKRTNLAFLYKVK